MTKFFKKMETYIGALFAQIWARMNFPRKSGLSLFSIYSPLTSCKKSEKSN